MDQRPHAQKRERDDGEQSQLLGSAVRALREGQHLSVRTLAKAAGFSASFISQVENGLASPSIASMERIANALGVSLSEFFSRQVSHLASPVVIRAGEGKELSSEWSHATVRALGQAWEGRILSPVLLTLAPGGRSGAAPAVLRGEEFAIVLSGTAQLRLSDATHDLEAGDSIHLMSGIERVWENPEASEARILLVSSHL